MKNKHFIIVVSSILVGAVQTSSPAYANGKFDVGKRVISITKTPPSSGGTVLKRQMQVNGTAHETYYNPKGKVHFSRDVAPDGTITSGHWTDHETGQIVNIGD